MQALNDIRLGTELRSLFRGQLIISPRLRLEDRARSLVPSLEESLLYLCKVGFREIVQPSLFYLTSFETKHLVFPA